MLFFLFWRGNKEGIIKTLGWYSVSDVPLHVFDLWDSVFVRLYAPGRSLTCCPRSAGCRPLVPSTTCHITPGSLPGCRGVSCSQTRRGELKAEWPLHVLPSLDFPNGNVSKIFSMLHGQICTMDTHGYFQCSPGFKDPVCNFFSRKPPWQSTSYLVHTRLP